jgi:hypothetical protein
MGNIITGLIVLLVIGFTVFNLVNKIRKGKSPCGCDACGGACPACDAKAKMQNSIENIKEVQ